VIIVIPDMGIRRVSYNVLLVMTALVADGAIFVVAVLRSRRNMDIPRLRTVFPCEFRALWYPAPHEPSKKGGCQESYKPFFQVLLLRLQAGVLPFPAFVFGKEFVIQSVTLKKIL
jgi:hypothetical protein